MQRDSGDSLCFVLSLQTKVERDRGLHVEGWTVGKA